MPVTIHMDIKTGSNDISIMLKYHFDLCFIHRSSHSFYQPFISFYKHTIHVSIKAMILLFLNWMIVLIYYQISYYWLVYIKDYNMARIVKFENESG